MEKVESAWGAVEANPYFWDWITFICLGLTVLGVLIGLVWILGLPGRIAIARNHPDAEAVYTMGWVGFVAIVPWIQALIWAFKPTDKVDIRYFPEQERIAEQEELARLYRYVYGKDLPQEQIEKLQRRAAGKASPEMGSPEADGGTTPDPNKRES